MCFFTHFCFAFSYFCPFIGLQGFAKIAARKCNRNVFGKHKKNLKKDPRRLPRKTEYYGYAKSQNNRTRVIIRVLGWGPGCGVGPDAINRFPGFRGKLHGRCLDIFDLFLEQCSVNFPDNVSITYPCKFLYDLFKAFKSHLRGQMKPSRLKFLSRTLSRGWRICVIVPENPATL